MITRIKFDFSRLKRFLPMEFANCFIPYGRRQRLEEELLQSVWKVKIDDIELQKSRRGGGSRVCTSCRVSRCHRLTLLT